MDLDGCDAAELRDKLRDFVHDMWKDSTDDSLAQVHFFAPGNRGLPRGGKPDKAVRYDSLEKEWLDETGHVVVSRDKKRKAAQITGNDEPDYTAPSAETKGEFLAECWKTGLIFEPGSFLGLRIEGAALAQMDEEVRLSFLQRFTPLDD